MRHLSTVSCASGSTSSVRSPLSPRSSFIALQDADQRPSHERYLCERAGSDASAIRDADASVGDSGILLVEVLRRVVATSGCGALHEAAGSACIGPSFDVFGTFLPAWRRTKKATGRAGSRLATGRAAHEGRRPLSVIFYQGTERGFLADAAAGPRAPPAWMLCALIGIAGAIVAFKLVSALDVRLIAGANWNELMSGTNAIWTALSVG